MDWKEKIIEGMKLIKEGCKESPMCIGCYDCPYSEYCTAIVSQKYDTPETEWEELGELRE